MDAAVWFGILQAATVVVALVLLYRPLGDYIALVYGSPPPGTCGSSAVSTA